MISSKYLPNRLFNKELVSKERCQLKKNYRQLCQEQIRTNSEQFNMIRVLTKRLLKLGDRGKGTMDIESSERVIWRCFQGSKKVSKKIKARWKVWFKVFTKSGLLLQRHWELWFWSTLMTISSLKLFILVKYMLQS